jgi:hypothetical protein
MAPPQGEPATSGLFGDFGVLCDAVLIRFGTNAALDLKAVAIHSSVVRTLARDRATMRVARRRLMLHDISGYRRQLIGGPQRI